MTGNKKRVQPVRRKVKHLDWIMKWFIRTHDCGICGKSLLEGYDARNPGKCITLHHTEGNREIDNWEDLEYVGKMVICHSACHRSYHLTDRHEKEGKQANVKKLRTMEKNIRKSVKIKRK